MRALLAVLSIFVATVAAVPQEPLIIRRGEETFLLYSNDAGEAVLVEVDRLRVVVWDEPSDPDDPDDDDPAPPENETVQNVRDWAREVGDTDGAQKFAAIFASIRNVVESGELDHKNALAAVRLAADRVMTDNWDGFRDKLSEHATKLSQEGKLGDRVGMLNFLASCRRGLELAAAGAVAIEFDETDRVQSQARQAITNTKANE